jgi:hypothetical protein
MPPANNNHTCCRGYDTYDTCTDAQFHTYMDTQIRIYTHKYILTHAITHCNTYNYNVCMPSSPLKLKLCKNKTVATISKLNFPTFLAPVMVYPLVP